MNRLLDTALDLPERERLSWIESLPPEYDSFKPRLRELLSLVRSQGYLSTIPKIEPPAQGDEIGGPRRLEKAGDEKKSKVDERRRILKTLVDSFEATLGQRK